MITARTKLDNKMQAELTMTALIIYSVLMYIGAIGVLAYIFLSTFLHGVNLDFLLFFSVPLGFGLVFYITIKKQNDTISLQRKVNVYAFERDHMIVKTISNGEEIGSSKVYYKEIIRKRETKNYIFLYPNKVNAYPVSKEELNEQELTELRKLLGMKEKKQKQEQDKIEISTKED